MTYTLAVLAGIGFAMIIMAGAAVEAGMRGLAPSPGKAPRSVRERLGYEECSKRDWNAWCTAITGHVGHWYPRTKASTRRAIAAVVTSMNSADILWLQKDYDWHPVWSSFSYGPTGWSYQTDIVSAYPSLEPRKEDT